MQDLTEKNQENTLKCVRFLSENKKSKTLTGP